MFNKQYIYIKIDNIKYIEYKLLQGYLFLRSLQFQ